MYVNFVYLLIYYFTIFNYEYCIFIYLPGVPKKNATDLIGTSDKNLGPINPKYFLI